MRPICILQRRGTHPCPGVAAVRPRPRAEPTSSDEPCARSPRARCDPPWELPGESQALAPDRPSPSVSPQQGAPIRCPDRGRSAPNPGSAALQAPRTLSAQPPVVSAAGLMGPGSSGDAHGGLRAMLASGSPPAPSRLLLRPGWAAEGEPGGCSIALRLILRVSERMNEAIRHQSTSHQPETRSAQEPAAPTATSTEGADTSLRHTPTPHPATAGSARALATSQAPSKRPTRVRSNHPLHGPCPGGETEAQW